MNESVYPVIYAGPAVTGHMHTSDNLSNHNHLKGNYENLLEENLLHK
jgi:hypothetical protein